MLLPSISSAAQRRAANEKSRGTERGPADRCVAFLQRRRHPDVLVDLPAAGITGVQLNNGSLVHEDFLLHARAERQLPGEGELDIVGLIHAVRHAGFTGPYCVESNTPEFRALPVAEATRRAADSATGVLRSAGVLAS